MLKKVKIMKKTLKYPCRGCSKSERGTPYKREKCPHCKGTGVFKDGIYYFILEDKNGNKVAFDADNLN